MALQDLTPQLRTRLSRMERAVGWFVALAGVLLVIGFAYYIQNTAKRRGWFLEKISYRTCVSNGAGLKVGDPVKLMGFDVGEITAVIPNAPDQYFNITIEFRVMLDHYNYPGYIWSDSKVKVSSEILGNRFLEITKGVDGVPTVLETKGVKLFKLLLRDKVTELEKSEEKRILDDKVSFDAAMAQLNPDEMHRQVTAAVKMRVVANSDEYYTNRAEPYFLWPLESPAVSERLDKLVTQVERALPDILSLTNQITATLSNTVTLTSNLNALATTAQPAAANLAALTAQLRGQGAFGEWALGTDGKQKLMTTLDTANNTLAHTDTNLTALVEDLGVTLENLAGITSNLHAQVAANTNLLGGISDAVIHTDELVQGLKKHWLLRSAFRAKKPAAKPSKP